MFIQALMKVLYIYGITIVVSMTVAVLIKVLVVATGRVNKPAKAAASTALTQAALPVAPPQVDGVSAEVVAAISAALAIVTGSHRILYIGESKRSWSSQGRIAQHSHNPR